MLSIKYKVLTIEQEAITFRVFSVLTLEFVRNRIECCIFIAIKNIFKDIRLYFYIINSWKNRKPNSNKGESFGLKYKQVCTWVSFVISICANCKLRWMIVILTGQQNMYHAQLVNDCQIRFFTASLLLNLHAILGMEIMLGRRSSWMI